MLLEAFQHRTVGGCVHVRTGQYTYGNGSFRGKSTKSIRKDLTAEIEHRDIHPGAGLFQFGQGTNAQCSQYGNGQSGITTVFGF